ncbi:MAG: ATP-binding protein [Flavobacteriales bacterium]|nr:ATP-binding protein [Flavobacteriales bacterium]
MTSPIYPHLSRIDLLLEDAYRLRVNDIPTSILLTQEALELSKALNDQKAIGRSMVQLALFLMINGDYEKSMNMSLAALTIFDALGDEKGVADAKYNIAGIYYKTDDYHLGLSYLMNCLGIYKKIQDYHNQSKVEKSLGTIYEYFGDRKNALKSYKNGIAAAKKANDENAESNCYNPLSGILLKENKPLQALKIIERSIEMKQKTGDLRGLAFALYGRGKVYTFQKKYDDAETDLLKAVDIHIASGEKLGLGMAYYKLGVLYAAWDKTKKAKSILKQGIAFSKIHANAMIKYKCNKLLYQIYKSEGNLRLSLVYLEKYQKEKESVVNTQTLRVIQNYEVISRVKEFEKDAESQKERAEILEKKNRAEEAARIKQEFLSTMSHEIRTPLNAVITISSLLQNNEEDSDKMLLHSLRFSANNLMRIVNDILDFTKLESEQMTLDPRDENLAGLLFNIRNTYAGLAEEKGLRLRLYPDKHLASLYHFDDTRLTQIMGNLISNAIKFTDEGVVCIHAKIENSGSQSDTIRFSVTDTGDGVALENLESIFESFSQPKSVTTRRHGGTGLGLAIVKKLVSLFNGEIKVKSEPGQGCEFSFTIEVQHSSKIGNGLQDSEKKIKIRRALIAEDNMVNAMVVGYLLKSWDIAYDHANNGAEAINFARLNSYDIILMDIHMPEISGNDAAKEIRSTRGLNQHIPIFALTADITADQEVEYHKNFNGFLLKPIEIERLKDCLAAVSENIRIVDEL